MPSSQHQQISKLIDLIMRLNPQSILDIGAGFGKYGVLCREYLELWDGRYEYNNFKRRIDCIEVFSNYITSIHQFVYNNIYIGNAVNIINKLETNYDLVLLIDVIEHFDKKTGRTFLKKLIKKNRNVIVSTPKYFFEQGSGFGNKYEIHKSHWTKTELELLVVASDSGGVLWIEDESSHIYLYNKEKNDNIIDKRERKI